MNKNFLTIGISTLIILAVAVTLLFAINSGNPEKCGDGICGPVEEEKGICPEDCTGETEGAGAGGAMQGKCGDGVCGPVEKEKGICPEDCTLLLHPEGLIQQPLFRRLHLFIDQAGLLVYGSPY